MASSMKSIGSEFDSGVGITALLATNSSAVTKENAKEMLEALDTMISMNTQPLSEKEKTQGRTMIKKITKFINRSGSELDELRAKVYRISRELSDERIRTTNLEKRIKSMENEKLSVSALMKANDLATLFRAYFLDLDWNAVTQEYSTERDNYENNIITLVAFEKFKGGFNARYPTPGDSPLLSVIIEICQERHAVAHSGRLKTIVRQDRFLSECAAFFCECGDASEYTAPCLAMLNMLQVEKTTNGLHGL